MELKLYNDVPHLLTPVITDPKRAFQALQYCLYEMERRYALLDHLGVRDIRSYNRRLVEREEKLSHGPLPYLVIVIDEFADLMATTGKELEATLARLAAMARAVGIHIVLATQRPSIDVITGLIKANIPSRIAFMVAGKFDSRIIIDAVGAEKLLGRGDMLFVPAWDSNPLRIQGALVSEEEVERITEKVRELGEPDYIDEDILFDDEETELVLEPGGNRPDDGSGAGDRGRRRQGVRLLPAAQAQDRLQPRRAAGGGDGAARHRGPRQRQQAARHPAPAESRQELTSSVADATGGRAPASASPPGRRGSPGISPRRLPRWGLWSRRSAA